MKLKFARQRWLQVLIGGVAAFAAADLALQRSGNLNMMAFVVLVGAFLVPVTFVVFFYGYVRDRDISMPLLTTCFIIGGLIGVAAAAAIEYPTIKGQDFLSSVGVGLIEESAKLIFPLAVFLLWKYRHEADGLLFGVASGMGFAALETAGYAFGAFVSTRGDVSVLHQVLLFRGIVSPAGHAAWTGFICATLWRARGTLRRNRVLAVAGAFIVGVALHTFWDVTAGLNTQTASQRAVYAVASAAIIAAGLALIIWRLRESRALTVYGQPPSQ